MELALVIAVSIAFAAICVMMARTRGRSEMLWGLLGFCFGPIPVIILAVLGART